MIKVAIIGVGAVANEHIRAYQTFKDRCQIVALVDIFPDKAAEKIKDFGLDARVYESYEDLLANEDFDLASICTPPFGHGDASIALLNAGKHVLCEKPMATSLEECDAMIEAEKSGGAMLSIVAQNRYKTPLWNLKRVLEADMIGKVVYARVDSYWWRGNNYYDLWWRGTWEKEGGGCTITHAVHHIDLFHWMNGMPVEVQGFITNLAHDNSEVEDFSTGIVKYPDGRIGQINTTLVYHGEIQSLTFQGELAAVGAPWKVAASTPMGNGFPEENIELQEKIQAYFDGLPALEYEGHTGQIDNMLSAIEGKAEVLITGVEGRKTMELAVALYQSSVTGQPVSLPITPVQPFYTRQGILENAPVFHQKTRSVDNFTTEEITFGSDYKGNEEED